MLVVLADYRWEMSTASAVHRENTDKIKGENLVGTQVVEPSTTKISTLSRKTSTPHKNTPEQSSCHASKTSPAGRFRTKTHTLLPHFYTPPYLSAVGGGFPGLTPERLGGLRGGGVARRSGISIQQKIGGPNQTHGPG